jgi:N-acetylglucosaminyldiphosphoundecaprenol N-acetyl-beta-D-mannosaminyltransferase
MESRHSDANRRIQNAAGLVTPDGMPLVWLLKLAGFKHAERVYGPDLMLAVFGADRMRGCRHFLYGTTDATLASLREALGRRFPQVRIVGSIAPPFRPLSPAEDDAYVERINGGSPDIVWVGLGAPKQEQWMAEHRNRLTAPVLIGVGAAFDIHAGVLRQAPRFFQRSGLEWAFRLYMEPRRLWRRYLRNNPQFIADVLTQKMGLRRFDIDPPHVVQPNDSRAT